MKIVVLPSADDHSPLSSIQPILRVFHYLGAYPLIIRSSDRSDDQMNAAFFVRRTVLQVLGVTLVGWLQSFFLFALLFKHNEKFEEVKVNNETGRDTTTTYIFLGGLTVLDMSVLWVSPLASLLTTILLTRITANKRFAFIKLIQEWAKISPKFAGQGQFGEQCRKLALGELKVFYVMGVAVTIAFVWYDISILAPTVWENETIICYAIIFLLPLFVYFAILNPIILCAFFKTSYFIKHLS